MELSAALQWHAADVIKSLLRTEKNQQIMCEVGLLSDIFALCKLALEDEGHPLHEAFQYLLERLSAQKLEPGDLRAFLRLGSPLSCDAASGEMTEQSSSQSQSAFVHLSRIKTL